MQHRVSVTTVLVVVSYARLSLSWIVGVCELGRNTNTFRPTHRRLVVKQQLNVVVIISILCNLITKAHARISSSLIKILITRNICVKLIQSGVVLEYVLRILTWVDQVLEIK